MRLIYHQDAEAELVEAALFYKSRVPALGGEFLEAVDAAIAKIQETPERWRIVDGEVRNCVMRRFPYGIHYRLLAGEIRILAFKHHSRHPDYWRYRLVD
jgi:toxin ParE1/3/4